MDGKMLTTMRAMAWERAKGELGSVLATYYPEYDLGGKEVDAGFDTANNLIKTFINSMEEEVLYE
jgi:hypothetical protein